jgi:hypothetical protein
MNALTDAVAWITREIVGNEIKTPLPASLRNLIAQRMVDDDFMGWPDIEAAHAQLDEWEWTP